MNSDIMVRDYISIARPNHWFKNVFMIPGAILGLLTSPSENVFIGLRWFILGFISTCIISSSNYTINELLDAPEDRKHPIKKQRPVAQGKIKYSIAVIQWFILIILGLTIAWKIGKSFFLIQVLFIVMALLYNLKPIRLKDKPFLDVISESVNNPIRFLLGWYAVQCQLIPPISMIFSYWMLGAFFMAIKRFAELRYIANSQMASSYRKSFAYYTEERLMISIIFYATAFALFLGIFLIRYRIELILSIPFIAGFMAYYMHLGFLRNSPTQYPENLYKQKAFVIYGLLTVIVLIICTFIRLPWLSKLFEATIPRGF